MHFIKKMLPCHTSNIPITLNKHLNQRYSFTIKYVGIPLLASIPKFSRNLPHASGAIANVFHKSVALHISHHPRGWL